MKLCIILADQSQRTPHGKIGDFLATTINGKRLYVWHGKFWGPGEEDDFNATANKILRDDEIYGAPILAYAVAEPVAQERPNARDYSTTPAPTQPAKSENAQPPEQPKAGKRGRPKKQPLITTGEL